MRAQRGIAIRGTAGGAGRQHISSALQVRRANALLAAGQPAAALAEANALLDHAQGNASWVPLVALRIRVGALRALARVGEAEDLLPTLLERSMCPPLSEGNRARALMEAAELRLAQGRAAEAAVFAQEAVELWTALLVVETPRLRRARELAAFASKQPEAPS